MIDLRSDTVTQPDSRMREVMMSAEVGDDVLGDDPTVRALEEKTAALLGKEAAVYTPSGTMANQIALRSQTEPGREIILDETAHMYNYEGGAAAALSGVTCKLLRGERGIFSGEMVRGALRSENVHYPPTALVVVENTSNRGGGSIWPLEKIRGVRELCLDRGLRTHLDGARLWNASVATGISLSEYASHFDTVSVCFSKGLGAPVGSALVGDREVIKRACRFRKMFGGGMRQAGIIAAGAIFALENNLERLSVDHRNSAKLAAGIEEIPGVEIDPDTVETNIVIFEVTAMPAAKLVKLLGERGVAVLATSETNIRAVTNLSVSEADIDAVLKILDEILA